MGFGHIFCLFAIGCASFTSSLRAEPAKNVLFIAIDDLKPSLGCYGDSIAKTPRIDALAKSGIVFTNAHCQWPVCGPSRASLMTSLRPEATGVMDLKTDMRAKNPDVLALPQYFRARGYVTAGTGKIYDPRCVDDRSTMDAPSWTIPFRHHKVSAVSEPDGKQATRAPDVKDTDLTDGQILRIGLALMGELAEQEKPFFLAVGFKKPHLPFVAPKRFWDRYDRADFPLASHRGGIAGGSGYCLHDSPELRSYGGVPKTGPIPDDLQRELIHGYFACTSYVDALVGRLLEGLDAHGLQDDTVIVLWGDHGFHLGDHGLWGKHTPLEQATRSPLIFTAPGLPGNRQSGAPAELTDIFPTLCELTGLPIPDGLHGRSLAPIWRGESESVRKGALSLFSRKGSYGYSYRTGRHRYIEWVNKSGKTVATDLFDYQTDPLEQTNLAGHAEHQALIKTLARSLREEADGTGRLGR